MATTQTQTSSKVRAQAKWVRCSARKARLVLDTIRGRSVPEARTVLAFSTRAVAREVDKVLRSAVANAEANHNQLGDEMFVFACYADEGPSLKRWKPRARGRADRFIKSSCHITIELAPLAEETTAASSRPAGVVGTPEPARAPKPAPSAPAEEMPEATETAASETEPAEERSETKPKAARKPAAKSSAKKTDEGEADKPAAGKRKPKAKKAEE
jgi:large subunit ribosomal protein L22